MDTLGGPQVLSPLVQTPSSPPVTPNASDPLRMRTGRIRPNYKRHGMVGGFYFSPPSDDGSSRDVHARPSTPELLTVPRSLSRPSSSSGLEESPRHQPSTPEVDTQSETSDRLSSTRSLQREEFELIIEEISEEDLQHLEYSGVLTPDAYSEVNSERAPSPHNPPEDDMTKQFEKMCRDLDEDEEERKVRIRRRQQRRHRWSSTRSKRTWSESCGSDADEPDSPLLFEDVGSSARRVKRRKSDLNERISLHFDDPPQGHITEVDEPEDDFNFIDAPPAYAEIEVDWSSLRDMPFYEISDPMTLDLDTSVSSSDDESDD